MPRDKTYFNYVLSSTRVHSEHAFGILTQTYGIFDKSINMDLETIDNAILACIALHNFRRKTNAVIENDEFDDENDETNDVSFEIDDTENDITGDAREIRDYLKDFLQYDS